MKGTVLLKLLKKTDAHAYTTSVLYDTSIQAIFSAAELHQEITGNWSLFEENFSRNSTNLKTASLTITFYSSPLNFPLSSLVKTDHVVRSQVGTICQ